MECRQGQSTTLSVTWLLLHQLRIPSLLQTKEVIKEKEMPKVLCLEKGRLTSHMTTIFRVKERSNEGIEESQVLGWPVQ